MVRPDSAEDRRVYAFAGFLLQKRIVEESDKSLSSAHANDEVGPTLFVTVFRKIFLANVPSNTKQSILLGYRIDVNGCKFSGTQDINDVLGTTELAAITALMDNCQPVMQCVAPLEPFFFTRLNISVIMYKYSNEGLFSCNVRLYSLTSCKPVLLKMSNNASMFFTKAAV